MLRESLRLTLVECLDNRSEFVRGVLAESQLPEHFYEPCYALSFLAERVLSRVYKDSSGELLRAEQLAAHARIRAAGKRRDSGIPYALHLDDAVLQLLGVAVNDSLRVISTWDDFESFLQPIWQAQTDGLLQLPHEAIVATYRHDDVEDGIASLAEIRKQNGPRVAAIVDTLTSVSSHALNRLPKQRADAETLRRQRFAQAHDPLAFYIKVAGDFPSNAWSLEYLRGKKGLTPAERKASNAQKYFGRFARAIYEAHVTSAYAAVDECIRLGFADVYAGTSERLQKHADDIANSVSEAKAYIEMLANEGYIDRAKLMMRVQLPTHYSVGFPQQTPYTYHAYMGEPKSIWRERILCAPKFYIECADELTRQRLVSGLLIADLRSGKRLEMHQPVSIQFANHDATSVWVSRGNGAMPHFLIYGAEPSYLFSELGSLLDERATEKQKEQLLKLTDRNGHYFRNIDPMLPAERQIAILEDEAGRNLIKVSVDGVDVLVPQDSTGLDVLLRRYPLNSSRKRFRQTYGMLVGRGGDEPELRLRFDSTVDVGNRLRILSDRNMGNTLIPTSEMYLKCQTYQAHAMLYGRAKYLLCQNANSINRVSPNSMREADLQKIVTAHEERYYLG